MDHEPHIKPDTLNLIEEEVGKNLKHINIEEIFLNKTPVTYALRSTIDKWVLMKLQSFCKSGDTVNRQPRDRENIFITLTSTRELVSNI